MTFTDQQFETLAPFERYFVTANRSNYGYCGSKNAERIHAVLKEAGIYSPNHRTSYTCSRCVLDLLKRAGALWLADKQERIDAANQEAAIAASQAAEAARKPAAAPKSTKTVKAAKSAPKSKTEKK